MKRKSALAGIGLVSMAVACGGSSPPLEEERLQRGPCETVEGWEQVIVPFHHFDEPDESGAGVELCVPPDTRLSASQNFEHAITLSGPSVFSDLILSVHPDFEAAVLSLRNDDRSLCEQDEYLWEFVDVGGWPALEQHYVEDVEGDERRASTANVYVAAGHHHLSVGSSVVPAGESLLIDTVVRVGHTLTSLNEAEPVDLDAVLSDLVEGHSESCP